MNTEKQARLQACLTELASLLYEQTDKSKLIDLENIEKTVRTSIVGAGKSRYRPFFIEKTTGIKTGKTRRIKSCVGVLKLKATQVERLGLKSRSQLSPLLEKCCLRLCANESYQNAEAEIEAASRRTEYSARRTALH